MGHPKERDRDRENTADPSTSLGMTNLEGGSGFGAKPYWLTECKTNTGILRLYAPQDDAIVRNEGC
jgi:hypothetical protein